MKILAFVSVLLLFNSIAAAQTRSVEVTRLMSAAEFAEAGLNKLTSEELAKLNAWLTSFSLRLLSSGVTDPDNSVIETRIDGEFQCWDGETVFKMLNGQIWQQSSYAYKYCYKYSPAVLIYKAGNTYKMKVDGVDGEISVRRLR
jgi:hypothetical protein